VRILGKRDEPGRPLIYGTTTHFLEFFGLASLKDLPTLREFTELTDESRERYEEEIGESPNEMSAVEDLAATTIEQGAVDPYATNPEDPEGLMERTHAEGVEAVPDSGHTLTMDAPTDMDLGDKAPASEDE